MARQRRNTQQRELVLEAARALAGTHPTAAQVYAYVHERNPHVSLATVYRNLNLLAEDGTILSIETTGGRHFDDRVDDHGHLVCRNCGLMVDVAMPYEAQVDRAVEDMSGFTQVAHHTVFEGLCPGCAREAQAR